MEWHEHWPVSDEQYLSINQSRIIMGTMFGSVKSVQLRWVDWIYTTVRKLIDTHAHMGNNKMDVAKIGASLYCKAHQINRDQHSPQEDSQAIEFKHILMTMLNLITNLMVLASGSVHRLYLFQHEDEDDIISIETI